MTRPVRSFAIVPAAGNSVRMGRPKLLLPWAGSTIIERTLAAWRAAGVTVTTVVVRSDDEALAERVRAAGDNLVMPEFPPPDMKASVQCALEFIAREFDPAPVDVWLVAPADMPTLSPSVIQALIAQHDRHQPSILIPRHNHRRGHPVLIPWQMAERVSLLEQNQGINTLVDKGPTRFIEMGIEAIPRDIDTPQDFDLFRPEGS